MAKVCSFESANPEVANVTELSKSIRLYILKMVNKLAHLRHI